MGTRHTQFFMDKEYPNVAMGGGSGGGGSKDITIATSVSGGYNGGATITITANGTTIFTATAPDTYNMNYNKTIDVVSVDNATVDILVTPPSTDTDNLGIKVSSSIDMLSYQVHPNGANTSYGYNFSDTDTLTIPQSSGGGGGGSSSGINYSTDEQVIGTWVDGKPLYQKTLYYQNFQGGTFEVDIENAEMGFITEGYLIQAGGANKAVFLLNGWLYDTGHVGLYGYIDDICRSDTHKMRLNVYKTEWSGEVYLTIRYTKTTD